MGRNGPGLHVLHIAKTGGTTLNAMLKTRGVRHTADGRPVVIHNHSTNLADVLSRNRRNQAAVFLREPLSRFVSGFNSRLREGRPEKDVPWRPEEVVAFKYFVTPNDLAEALSARRAIVQDRAYFAMQALPHSRNRYTFYLRSPEYMTSRIDKIAFVGFQETYNEDVSRFFSVLGFPEEVEVEHRHKAPPTSSTELSTRATRNLRAWFADDIALYDWTLSKRHLFSAERSVQLSQVPDDAGEASPEESVALEGVNAIDEVAETTLLEGEDLVTPAAADVPERVEA